MRQLVESKFVVYTICINYNSWMKSIHYYLSNLWSKLCVLTPFLFWRVVLCGSDVCGIINLFHGVVLPWITDLRDPPIQLLEDLLILLFDQKYNWYCYFGVKGSLYGAAFSFCQYNLIKSYLFLYCNLWYIFVNNKKETRIKI